MSQILPRRAIHGVLVALCLLGTVRTAALAQVRFDFGVGIAVPGMRIGINIPAYPQLVPIPGYPVYYAPQLDANLFFYDGYYWLFANDEWYSSTWYNGPWYLVPPERIPDFILRVPVRFYRRPPLFFRDWNRDGPPRWGEHWGPGWQRSRPGWDRWNRGAPPPRAPLPGYQRQYPHTRYPGASEQRALENRYYRFPQGRPPGYPPADRRMPPPRYQQQPREQQRYQEQQRYRQQPREQQRYQEQQRYRQQPREQQQQQQQQQRRQQESQRRDNDHRPEGRPPG